MAKKARKPRQSRLPGTQDAIDIELRKLFETAKRDYDEQQDATKIADESRVKMQERMQDLKIATYKANGYEIEVDPGKAKLKWKKAKGEA